MLNNISMMTYYTRIIVFVYLTDKKKQAVLVSKAAQVLAPGRWSWIVAKHWRNHAGAYKVCRASSFIGRPNGVPFARQAFFVCVCFFRAVSVEAHIISHTKGTSGHLADFFLIVYTRRFT